ncbi:Hsp20/alpha crystallin family protein [Gemmatimonas sp.]
MTYSFPIAPTFPAATFRRELDRMFEDAFGGRPADGQWQPQVTAREDGSGYTLDIDLPGVDPAQVEVLTEDSVLTVRGTRSRREPGEGEKVLFAEPSHGTFLRRFRLPKHADLQAVNASYALGTLTIHIAKIVPVQPRRVPVTVNGQVSGEG